MYEYVLEGSVYKRNGTLLYNFMLYNTIPVHGVLLIIFLSRRWSSQLSRLRRGCLGLGIISHLHPPGERELGLRRNVVVHYASAPPLQSTSV